MSITVNCVNEKQAKKDLKKCTKDVREYVKALEASNERWKYVNDQALKKIREQAKIISSNPVLCDSLPSVHQCRYSKAMNQEYPRKCIDCGKPEGNVA